MKRPLSSKIVCNVGSLRAVRCEMQDYRTDKVSRYVSAVFEADGSYKSCVCRLAEEAGVRYISHRVGYHFSVRAWDRFRALLEENAARYPQNWRYAETLESIRLIEYQNACEAEWKARAALRSGSVDRAAYEAAEALVAACRAALFGEARRAA